MSECLFSLEVKLLAGLNEKLPEKYRKKHIFVCRNGRRLMVTLVGPTVLPMFLLHV